MMVVSQSTVLFKEIRRESNFSPPFLNFMEENGDSGTQDDIVVPNHVFNFRADYTASSPIWGDSKNWFFPIQFQANQVYPEQMGISNLICLPFVRLPLQYLEEIRPHLTT